MGIVEERQRSRQPRAAVLVRMGREELDRGTAPEVAREAGAAAFVTGALMRIGPDRLRLDVRVQDADSDRILFSEPVEGEDVKSVFRMVDSLTARMTERFLPAASAPDKGPVSIANTAYGSRFNEWIRAPDRRVRSKYSRRTVPMSRSTNG